MIFRMLLALVAVLAASPASAQQPPYVPAPERHAATGLTFPQRIGPAEKATSTDYSKTMNRPDLGYAWNYGVPGQLSTTVYLYALGNTAIPPGPGSPVVIAQFDQAYRDIQLMAKSRNDELKPVQGPTECGLASAKFRCVTLLRIDNGDKRPIHTTLMVTGYRGYFLKIRSDAVPGPQGEAAVAGFFSSFLGQLR
jgi:hypothetical protein